MADQTETARELLWRHQLPEDVIDGALALHAQELAGKIRAHRDHTRGAVQATKVMDFAADLISPENWARTEPAVPAPAADQAALRDRIAKALACTQLKPPFPHCLAMADAVLAVVPAPADRAAVLREAADGFDRHAQQLLNDIGGKAVFVAKGLRDQAAVWSEAAETLRRLADETQQPEAGPECTCADAGDAFVPLGHYADCPQSAAVQQPKEADGPRTVCVCGHSRAEHLVVSGRLLCDECDGLSAEACKEFEAL